MSDYQPAQLDLSSRQLARLARGEKVRLKHEHLGRGISVHLTKTQHRKMARAQQTGKGFQLGFSQHQVNYHKGKGGFGSLFSGIAQSLAPQAIDAVSGLAGDQGKKLIDKFAPAVAKGFLNTALQEGLKFGNSRGKDELKHFLTGLSQSKNGSGLFSFIPGGVGDFLNDAGNIAVQLGVPLAQQAIGRKFGGGVKRKRRSKGEGLYLR